MNSSAAIVRIVRSLILLGAWSARLNADSNILSFNIASSAITCRNFSYAANDVITVNARLTAGSGGPPTSMTVSLPGRSSLNFSMNGSSSRGTTFTVNRSGSEAVCGTIYGWDRNDSATITVSRRTRPNITASPISFQGNGFLRYGYKSNSIPIASGESITVGLYYATINRSGITFDGTPLDVRTVSKNGNAAETFTVDHRGFRKPNPSWVTHLVVLSDVGNKLTEEDENDNTDTVKLPNLKPAKADRDGTDGSLDLAISYTPGEDDPSPTVKYRVGAKATNSVGDLSLYTPLVERAFRLGSATGSWTIPSSGYPLPAAQQNHFLAEVDPDNLVLESNEDDNAKTWQIDGIRGWQEIVQPFQSGNGIDFYRKPINGQTAYYLTVTRLRAANLRSSVVYLDGSRRADPVADHWPRMNGFNSLNYRLRFMVNGAFFSGGYSSAISTAIKFTNGLKVDGRVLSDRRDDYPASVIGFDGDQAAILPHSPATFASRWNNLIGVFNGSRVNMNVAGKSDQRTWVGFRDPVPGGGFQTMLTVTARDAEYREIIKELRPYGVEQVNQYELDGGSSTTLLVDGAQIFCGGYRCNPALGDAFHRLLSFTVPHMIAVFDTPQFPGVLRSSSSMPLPAEFDSRLESLYINAEDIERTTQQLSDAVVTLRIRTDGTVDALDYGAPQGWRKIETPKPIQGGFVCDGKIYLQPADGQEELVVSGLGEIHPATAAPASCHPRGGLRQGSVAAIVPSGTAPTTYLSFDGQVRQRMEDGQERTLRSHPYSMQMLGTERGILSIGSDGSLRFAGWETGPVTEIKTAGGCRQLVAIGTRRFAKCSTGIIEIDDRDSGVVVSEMR